MTTYKNVGGVVTDLADGSILAPGETKDLTKEQAADPFNKQLIDEGRLMATTETSSAEPKKKEGGDK